MKTLARIEVYAEEKALTEEKMLVRTLTHGLCRWNALLLTIAVALGMAMYCSLALAQSGAGSLQGTVTDSTGAVVREASVHVVNRATGVSTDTRSNSVGFYQVPELFTGTYDITISAPGFESYKTSIDLLVAQNAVINSTLTPGVVNQQVVVSGNAVQLTTTDSATISSTLERERINELPVNGRFLSGLGQLTTPGLYGGVNDQPGERANGLMPNATDYRIDGSNTTNISSGSDHNGKVQLIDPDSIQEVQFDMSNTGAQYAEPATAIISTKSGTNSLHGTAFETALNNALGVAKDRQDAYNYVAPPLIRNEFGINAGGPIILPHVYHGKNKSFWFFAYERYSDAARAAANYKVPTMAMRQGDFSGAISSAGILQTIYDPSTTAPNSACPVANSTSTSNNAYCRTPFQNNRISLSEESPAAAILYATIPPPTSAANPLVQNNLTTMDNTLQVVAQETGRLDHVFNENNRAYLRVTDNDCPVQVQAPAETSLAVTSNGVSLPAGATEGYKNLPLDSWSWAAGYTHVFSPTFYAETVAAEQWLRVDQFNGYDYGANYEKELGMPNNFGEPGFPSISGLIDNLVSSQTQILDNQIVWNLDENLTKIAGLHQMHFGVRWQHYRGAELPKGLADAISFTPNSTGLYQSSSGANYTDSSNTGIADASFFLGSASSYTVNLPVPHDHYHWDDIDAYFQDDYHVSRNLTFNLGLRYEARPSIWTKYGLMNTIDFKNDAVVLQAPPSTLIAEGYTTQAIITNDENLGMVFETPQEAGMPANLLRNYDLNFLPRVGFAYRLFGGKHGTVVRGGFARYTSRADTGDFLSIPVENNPLTATYSQSYATAAQAIDGLPNELLRYNDPVEFGVLGVNTSGVVNTSASNAILPGISQLVTSPNWPPVYISDANFTVEQPLKGNSVLRVSWVGTHSTNLDIAHFFNYNPSTYQWEMAHGTVPPNGGASVVGTPLQNTYSATATGPYNQTLWGNASYERVETGWMNGNELQVNYQRLFHHGFAYQIYYEFAAILRAGGFSGGSADTVGSATVPYADFPGAEGTVATMTSPYGTIGAARVAPPPPANVPIWADYHALNHYELYARDNTIPIHHIQFNGILDIPVGRGKWLFGNVNRFVDELIGNFQISGQGYVVSQAFEGPITNWGAESPLKVYKHKYPITDCTSGVCYKAYLWFNGYLSPKVTQGVAGSTCTTNCITGLPSDYVADQTPIDNTPGTTYFGVNEVQISAPGLNGGTPQNIVFDAGWTPAHYGAGTFLNGPMNWEADASLFKLFPITERINLRVNMDAFNVFNHQGYPAPNTTSGEEFVQPGVGVASSFNSPRQIQLTVRLTF